MGSIQEMKRFNDEDIPDPTFIINKYFNEVNQLKKEVVNKLLNLAKEVDKKQKHMRIAKIIFACIGITGTGVAIGGTIAAPFTFGASLGLTIAGASVGGVSGIGGVVTAIVEHIVNSSQMKEAEAAIARYEQKMNEMIETFDAHKDHEAFRETLVRILRAGLDAGGHGLHFGAAFGAAGARAAAATAGRTTVGALGASLKAVLVVGIVLSVLTLPLDIHMLVSNSMKIHGNDPSATAEQIRVMAKAVEEHQIFREIEENDDEGGEMC